MPALPTLSEGTLFVPLDCEPLPLCRLQPGLPREQELTPSQFTFGKDSGEQVGARASKAGRKGTPQRGHPPASYAVDSGGPSGWGPSEEEDGKQEALALHLLPQSVFVQVLPHRDGRVFPKLVSVLVEITEKPRAEIPCATEAQCWQGRDEARSRSEG